MIRVISYRKAKETNVDSEQKERQTRIQYAVYRLELSCEIVQSEKNPKCFSFVLLEFGQFGVEVTISFESVKYQAIDRFDT